VQSEQGERADAAATSPHKSKSGLVRIWRAIGYSLAGLRGAYAEEHAFRQECLLALVLIPLALWLPVDNVRRALMIASMLLVLIVELMNSAVEAVVDRVSMENHPLAKRAKDIGSAAVMLSLLNLAVVWLFCIL
jgi:diacylglycerol kinase (ATP)